MYELEIIASQCSLAQQKKITIMHVCQKVLSS
jgi:hypothetical protein